MLCGGDGICEKFIKGGFVCVIVCFGGCWRGCDIWVDDGIVLMDFLRNVVGVCWVCLLLDILFWILLLFLFLWVDIINID